MNSNFVNDNNKKKEEKMVEKIDVFAVLRKVYHKY